MSCDWHIHCKTCDSTLTFADANHAIELMRYLIDHRVTIAALDPFFNSPDAPIWNLELVAGYRWRIDVSWFANHVDHELAPIDEYGRIDGTE